MMAPAPSSGFVTHRSGLLQAKRTSDEAGTTDIWQKGLKVRSGSLCRDLHRAEGFLVSDRSVRVSLVMGEVLVFDGNHLLEFRGFEALPVKPSQQPEASLACACGNV